MASFVIYEGDKKITIILKFPELRMFDFRIFFAVILVHMSVIMFTISAILDCHFVFDR